MLFGGLGGVSRLTPVSILGSLGTLCCNLLSAEVLEIMATWLPPLWEALWAVWGVAVGQALLPSSQGVE